MWHITSPYNNLQSISIMVNILLYLLQSYFITNFLNFLSHNFSTYCILFSSLLTPNQDCLSHTAYYIKSPGESPFSPFQYRAVTPWGFWSTSTNSESPLPTCNNFWAQCRWSSSLSLRKDFFLWTGLELITHITVIMTKLLMGWVRHQGFPTIYVSNK